MAEQPHKHFTATVPAPSKLDVQGDVEQNWRKFLRQWKNYSIATRLDKEDRAYQCAVFLACVGEDAQEVYEGLPFANDGEKTDIAVVLNKFEDFCVGTTHEVYESFKFHCRQQEEGETVESYVAVLRKMAKTCNFGNQENRMIRDRLVMGLRDDKTRQKLLEEKELDLDKAVQICRVQETSQIQVKSMTSNGEAAVQRLRQGKLGAAKPNEAKAYQGCSCCGNDLHRKGGKPTYGNKSRKKCFYCGRDPHSREECPAKAAECRKCRKLGHFAACCRSRRSTSVNEVEEDEAAGCCGIIKVEEVTCAPWRIKLIVNGKTQEFKLDTGADVTVLPEKTVPKNVVLQPAKKKLYGPSKSQITVIGKFAATLRHNDKTVVQDIYVIRGLEEPLLGRPAISELQLLSQVHTVQEQGWRGEFPQLFTGLGQVENDYRIRLKDDARPYAVACPRKLAIPLQHRVKEELDNLQSMGVIKPVVTPSDWCAPIVVVPKSSEKIRLCVDFTKLNEAVKRENFPLPSTDQLLAQLGGATVFTKLDCNQGFHQIPLNPESQVLTTFITPFGRFCYTRLPFGISSGPEIFQRMMSQLLSDIPGVVCDMDDILVYGKTQSDHDSTLRRVLTKLRDSGLTLNSEKCEFSKASVRFLGHIISSKGVQIDPAKVRAIVDFPRPNDVSDVRRLLGMLNHVSKFAGTHLADISRPLRDLLKKDSAWIWDSMHEKAFQDIKARLSSAPVLAHYRPDRKTKISADASAYGLGAVLLQQQDDSSMKPVFYISRSLSPTEQRYAPIEKEALAVTWACEKLTSYIVGLKDLVIETDHKPLLALLKTRNLDELSPRIQRFRMRLMRYCYSIQYTRGKNQTTADALSRAPAAQPDEEDQELEKDTNMMVNLVIANLHVSQKRKDEIRELIQQDDVCRTLIRYCQHGWPTTCPADPWIKPYWAARYDISYQEEVLLHGTRIIVPEKLRHDILNRLHTGHQGVVKTRALAKDCVWWPGLSTQIEKLVESCPVCAKERRVPPEPLIPSPVPEYAWQKVGTDLFDFKGRNYLLVIDYFSKFIEIAHLQSTSSDQVIIHTKSIFSRHGIPEVVMSDNGTQYTSKQFKQFAEKYGFTHITSSPKYPQANGEAERAVQTVKGLLKRAEDPYLAMLNYRCTPLENSKSPAELCMGRRIRSTVPIVTSKLKGSESGNFRQKEEERKEKQKANFDKAHRARTAKPLAPGQMVWVKPQDAPGTIVRPLGHRSYEVETPTGKQRRNRRHLVPRSPQMPTTGTNDFIANPLPRDDAEGSDSAPPEMDTGPVAQEPAPPTHRQTVTRSGRVVKPPERLDL